MRVYLDNAATTPIDKEVLQAMYEVMETRFGNPSSIHSHGRESRALLEKARKTISTILKVSPSEIFFTSGGTEADNMAIRSGIIDHQIKHVITSELEHHAVLHPLQAMEREGLIRISYVKSDSKGNINFDHLDSLLQANERSFISLMQANNEIATITDIKRVGDLAEQYNALFHCDSVQTMGHFSIDVKHIKVHFLACSAHKLHGPKGIGFLYINHNVKISPMIFGGAQERNMRGGTENIYGIVGLAKAFEIAYRNMDIDRVYILELKSLMIQELRKVIPTAEFHGETSPENSLYTVLNVSFPPVEIADMLLFNLDIAGISASGGSACSSGSNIGSHVLRSIGADTERPAIRFSFSKYNTKAEILYTVERLKELFYSR